MLTLVCNRPGINVFLDPIVMESLDIMVTMNWGKDWTVSQVSLETVHGGSLNLLEFIGNMQMLVIFQVILEHIDMLILVYNRLSSNVFRDPIVVGSLKIVGCMS